MREAMNPWTFVIASYVIGVGATLAVAAWSMLTMRRAEKRRDSVRNR
ncbi:hypothetical protein [Novosphingobium panipatense]|uniref:Heme exporter protein D n=1 Tax=Novosphingobium panipatense TaxID=428991 RepID=A0ABY1QSP4_9SPHN|nr:hypothetical protein [Novosphingobium panipatense]SMP77948.1 hypothetical protein SAMN06296065_11042 [Novosphingobium panipatense]